MLADACGVRDVKRCAVLRGTGEPPEAGDPEVLPLRRSLPILLVLVKGEGRWRFHRNHRGAASIVTRGGRERGVAYFRDF